ncbi:MAG: hypothetical protein FJX74_19195 [Armatimonadetes bacterium]|nr:hypothetical protein [Armatimonadota bacterium]
MDCAYHAGVPAVGYCSGCGRAVCQACQSTQGNRSVCPVCAAGATAPQPVTPSPAPAASAGGSGAKGLLYGGLGCCAGVLVIGLVVGLWFGYRWYRSRPPQARPAVVASSPPAAQKTADSTPAPPAAQPGQPAADAAVRALHPSYGGQLKWRSDDWRRVKLWMGPEGKEPTTEVVLQWNDQTRAYEVERDAPIQRPKKATPKPGEAAAKTAALAKHQGWVARVVYHSRDWQRVKVWIGPPESEFNFELVLQWDGRRNRYVVERSSAIEYEPEGPQPSRDGAIAAARSTAGPDGYVIAEVDAHNEDWTWVSVLLGGEASEFDTHVVVQWTGDGYEVVEMEALNTGSGDAAAWEESHGGGEGEG